MCPNNNFIKNLSDIPQVKLSLDQIKDLMDMSYQMPWAYSVAAGLADKVGWCHQEDLLNCFRQNRSRSAAYRILNKLIDNKLVTPCRNGKLTVTPKRYINNSNDRMRVSSFGSDFTSPKAFNRNVVLQGALILQARYRWRNRLAIKEGESFFIATRSFKIQKAPKDLKGNIGAAFSRIAELLNLSKSYCHSLIRDLQTKNQIVLTRIHYRLFKEQGYRKMIAEDPKLHYEFNKANNLVTIFYKMASSYPTALKSYSKIGKLYKRSIPKSGEKVISYLQERKLNIKVPKQTSPIPSLGSNRLVHKMGLHNINIRLPYGFTPLALTTP